MRIFNFYLCLMCFLLATGVVNSQTLNKVYSGGKLPTEEGWQELKLDGTINPLAGTVSQEATNGSLKLKSTNDGNKFTQLGWYKTGLGLNLTTGYTIEIKAKVKEASKYGAFNIQGFDNEGKGFRIGIYDNYLAEQTNPFAKTNVLKDNLNNGDAFHTYRIAVKPTGIATLYRDEVEIGTFPVEAFYFDNIIENGGFEDGDNPDDKSSFPDFSTNALMYKSNDEDHVKTGGWALIMENDDMVGSEANAERARTQELPVKQNTSYNISISRKRVEYDSEFWCWRDMGAFWNTQDGTQNGADNRNPHAMFAGANEDFWQVHNQQVAIPEDTEVKSLRFEFPSWQRDDYKTYILTAFDDFFFSEDLGFAAGPKVEKLNPSNVPVFPENYVNLIANGSFEDHNLNNDGSEYEWALSNEDSNNEPVAYNAVWGGDVRIQKNDKPDDEVGGQWAYSGTSSLRFSTLGNKENNFNFTKELEPNKTYRFNFWTRNPKWPETAWVKVKIGDQVIWGQDLGSGKNNIWSNVDLVFTTTPENTTLSLFTTSEDHGNWYNIFFDDLVLYEMGAEELKDPYEGKTNLFANGDFEDISLGNDGKSYTWALSSSSLNPTEDNYPVVWSDFWGTFVRLQDCQKGSDTGLNWAHKGNRSMRFSRLDNNEKTNMDMKMELEPNKTYTFSFYFKTANYPDKGTLYVANGDLVLWGGGNIGADYVNWKKHTITFSTNNTNHTLRMYTEINGWFNFYLDDITLHEETYVPIDSETYVFFGKSTGTHPSDVEIEYVAIDNTGGYAPGEVSIEKISTENKNMEVVSSNGQLTFSVINPAQMSIYSVAGSLVAQLNVQKTSVLNLPKGIYVVKSVSQGATETIKVVNK